MCSPINLSHFLHFSHRSLSRSFISPPLCVSSTFLPIYYLSGTFPFLFRPLSLPSHHSFCFLVHHPPFFILCSPHTPTFRSQIPSESVEVKHISSLPLCMMLPSHTCPIPHIRVLPAFRTDFPPSVTLSRLHI